MTVEQCWQPVPGGSGTYIEELVAQLSRPSGARLTGLAARGHAVPVRGLAPSLPIKTSALPRAALYESWVRWRRPRAERAGAFDVVHATTWAVPGTRLPLVVTVHDLAFLRESSHFTPRGNRWFRRALQIVRDEATRVVVPSVATRDDCVAQGVEQSRVDVIPHGVRPLEVTADETDAWRAEVGLEGPYVLWVGTLEPRKNVTRLVEAFAAARHGGLSEHTLVLVGPPGWEGEAARVEAAVRSLPPGAVRVLGRLAPRALHAAYAGAAVFAYPSLWEGFGLPVLEAMAHGTPVVTSRGTSMAEVGGEAVELADPSNVADLAGALVRAAEWTPARREQARARAATFTWEASARQHLETYRRAVAEGC